MKDRLNTLSQVILSLKDDQNDVMNDINALLNNSSKETELIGKLKKNVRKLSQVHSDMEEVHSFISQLSNHDRDMHKKTPSKPSTNKK